MKAAVLRNKGNIILEDYPIRKLEDNEVLIKVHSCGVCGTDKHIYKGEATSKLPVILGHEYSGIAADVNKSTEFLSEGDKVVIDPNIYCGQCRYCREGKVNYCINLKALGVTLDGGFAEYSIVPRSQIYKIPAEFNLEHAAFAEPVSCCLRGIHNGEITQGETVIVIGGGSIGQLMVQLARISGASKIIIIEPVISKRNIALEYGADLAIDPSQENFFEKINDMTNGRPDVIIECVGDKIAVDLAVRISSKGTRIVIFGLAPKNQNININLHHLFINEIKIISSYLNPYLFEDAIELLISGRLQVSKMISEQFTLDRINNVFANDKNSQIIKYQIINNNKEAA